MVSKPKNYYRSEEEIEAIVKGFENCTLPDSQFKHAEHLTVALSYLHCSRLTVEEATTRIREALYRFLDKYADDRQAYNETITIFWIEIVNSFLQRTDTTRPIVDICNEMIESFGNSNLIYDYFSREHLLSKEAKTARVEPDVKPFDGGRN